MKLPLEQSMPTQTEEGTTVHFAEGLLGFPDLTEFRLFEPPDAYPLKFLQSEQQPEISFVCMDPAGIKPDYSFPLSPEDADFLSLEKLEDALVLTLVVIPEDPHRMTTNLAGPVVINVRSRKGRQIVLNSDVFPLQFPVLGQA